MPKRRVFVEHDGVLVPLEIEFTPGVLFFRVLAEKGDPSEILSLNALESLRQDANEGRTQGAYSAGLLRNVAGGPDMFDCFRIDRG